MITINEVKIGRLNKRVKRKHVLPNLLMSPALIVIIIVMIIPLVYGVTISMFDYQLGGVGIGKFIFLDNYINFFQSYIAIHSTIITLIFTISALLLELILGILLASLLLRIPRKLGKALRAIFTMPLLISPIIIGLMWRYMYDPTYGIIYQFLNLLHVGGNFGGLSSPSWSLLCIVIVDVWQTTPFILLVATAGLSSIPMELYEAGYIDGAGSFKTFRYITLPLLTKVIVVITMIRGVDAFRVFDIIYALTAGGPANSTLSLSIYAFQQGFINYQMGYSMAISIITMVILFIIFIPILRISASDMFD